MKIMICGKGGSGKSTVSVMLARSLSKRGFRVLLIDADESNLGLHRLLGVDAPQIILDSLGGKKGMRERRKDPLTGQRRNLFKPDMAWQDLGGDCVSESTGVSLASVGKIHEPGEGCACPMGFLSREIFSNLNIGDKDLVIIDTAAGIEHFGRDMGSHADLILGILDPSFESVLLSEKIATMAASKGYDAWFALNRAHPDTETAIRSKVPGLNLVASIAQNETIFQAGLEGQAVQASDPGIESLSDLITRKKEGNG